MPTFGLILSIEPQRGADVVDRLTRDPRARLGDPVGARLPMSWQTPACDNPAHALDGLQEIEGILHIDVAFADLSDVSPPASPNLGSRHER